MDVDHTLIVSLVESFFLFDISAQKAKNATEMLHQVLSTKPFLIGTVHGALSVFLDAYETNIELPSPYLYNLLEVALKVSPLPKLEVFSIQFFKAEIIQSTQSSHIGYLLSQHTLSITPSKIPYWKKQLSFLSAQNQLLLIFFGLHILATSSNQPNYCLALSKYPILVSMIEQLPHQFTASSSIVPLAVSFLEFLNHLKVKQESRKKMYLADTEEIQTRALLPKLLSFLEHVTHTVSSLPSDHGSSISLKEEINVYLCQENNNNHYTLSEEAVGHFLQQLEFLKVKKDLTTDIICKECWNLLDAYKTHHRSAGTISSQWRFSLLLVAAVRLISLVYSDPKNIVMAADGEIRRLIRNILVAVALLEEISKEFMNATLVDGRTLLSFIETFFKYIDTILLESSCKWHSIFSEYCLFLSLASPGSFSFSISSYLYSIIRRFILVPLWSEQFIVYQQDSNTTGDSLRTVLHPVTGTRNKIEFYVDHFISLLPMIKGNRVCLAFHCFNDSRLLAFLFLISTETGTTPTLVHDLCNSFYSRAILTSMNNHVGNQMWHTLFDFAALLHVFQTELDSISFSYSSWFLTLLSSYGKENIHQILEVRAACEVPAVKELLFSLLSTVDLPMATSLRSKHGDFTSSFINQCCQLLSTSPADCRSLLTDTLLQNGCEYVQALIFPNDISVCYGGQTRLLLHFFCIWEIHPSISSLISRKSTPLPSSLLSSVSDSICFGIWSHPLLQGIDISSLPVYFNQSRTCRSPLFQPSILLENVSNLQNEIEILLQKPELYNLFEFNIFIFLVLLDASKDSISPNVKQLQFFLEEKKYWKLFPAMALCFQQLFIQLSSYSTSQLLIAIELIKNCPDSDWSLVFDQNVCKRLYLRPQEMAALHLIDFLSQHVSLFIFKEKPTLLLQRVIYLLTHPVFHVPTETSKILVRALNRSLVAPFSMLDFSKWTKNYWSLFDIKLESKESVLPHFSDWICWEICSLNTIPIPTQRPTSDMLAFHCYYMHLFGQYYRSQDYFLGFFLHLLKHNSPSLYPLLLSFSAIFKEKPSSWFLSTVEKVAMEIGNEEIYWDSILSLLSFSSFFPWKNLQMVPSILSSWEKIFAVLFNNSTHIRQHKPLLEHFLHFFLSEYSWYCVFGEENTQREEASVIAKDFLNSVFNQKNNSSLFTYYTNYIAIHPGMWFTPLGTTTKQNAARDIMAPNGFNLLQQLHQHMYPTTDNADSPIPTTSKNAIFAIPSLQDDLQALLGADQCFSITPQPSTELIGETGDTNMAPTVIQTARLAFLNKRKKSVNVINADKATIRKSKPKKVIFQESSKKGTGVAGLKFLL